MKALDPGHVYQLSHIDGHGLSELVFVKREGPGYPGNIGSHPGTNLQEVIRVLIDRVKYLDGQIHDDRNDTIIDYLRATIMLLEARAADRHGRQLQVPIDEIESRTVCEKCGHIGCFGTCRHEQ